MIQEKIKSLQIDPKILKKNLKKMFRNPIMEVMTEENH